VILIGCASTPASPTAASSDWTGWWQGEWQITSCSGSRHCFTFFGTSPFTLRLSQTGSSVKGTLTVFPPDQIDIVGSIGADGSLVMTGTKPAASNSDGSGDLTLTNSSVRRDGQRGMVGTLGLRVSYTPQQNGESNSFALSGNVLNAHREPNTSLTATSLFAGHWVGRYVIRQCVPFGELTCLTARVGDVVPFDLTLAQSGSTVNGRMGFNVSLDDVMTVAGTTSENTLTLQGTASGMQSGVDPDLIRLTLWTTMRDELGRMRGSFSFRHELHWVLPHPPNNVPLYIEDIDVDLVSVALVAQ